MDLSADEKLNIIEKEYDIPVADGIRKDVSIMCNLSREFWKKEEQGEGQKENRRRKEIYHKHV